MTQKFIYGWRFKSGVDDEDSKAWANDDTPPGWYCSAYQRDAPKGFEEWMFANLKGSFACTLRFNGGNPMWVIFIEDERDAMLFKLRWNDYMEKWI